MGVRGRRHCSGSFDFNENTHASQHKGAEAGPQLVRELMNQRLEKSMFSGEIINHGEALPLILCWLTWPQIGCDPSSRLRGKLCRGLACWMPCCRLWQWRTKKFSKVFLICLVSAREGVIMTSWPERFQRGFFQLLLQVTQRPSKAVKQTGKAACLDQSQRQLGESCLCFFGFGWLKTGNFGSHSRTL